MECLLGYIKLLQINITRWGAVGVVFLLYQGEVRYARLRGRASPRSLKWFMSALGFCIPVAPSAPYFVLHCTYPFRGGFGCLQVFHFGNYQYVSLHQFPLSRPLITILI